MNLTPFLPFLVKKCTLTHLLERSMKFTFICAIALWIAFDGTAACSEIPGYVKRAVANPSRSKAEREADAKIGRAHV